MQNSGLICKLVVICTPWWGAFTKYTNRHNCNKRLTRDGLYMHAYEPTMCHNRQKNTIAIVVFDWLACKSEYLQPQICIPHKTHNQRTFIVVIFLRHLRHSLLKIIFRFSLVATILFIYKQKCAIFVVYRCICLYWIKWILLGCMIL